MSELDTQQQQDRRKVIKLLGTSAAALPVFGLVGCGGGADDGAGESAASNAVAELATDAAEAMEETASDVADAASDAVDAVAGGAESAMDAAEEAVGDAMDAAEDAVGDVVDAVEAKAEEVVDAVNDAVAANQVDENGPQAKSLGYKHDASQVDGGAYARYAAGQQCSNCQLYQGGDAPWGGCPIFAGKQVKATGWCNTYVAAS